MTPLLPGDARNPPSSAYENHHVSRAQGLEIAYPKAEGAKGGHLPEWEGVTETVSHGLHGEVLERGPDGDNNRRVRPVLLGVWSLWLGVLAGPAPARGKAKGAEKAQAARGLGRRMWGAEMEARQEGWRDHHWMIAVMEGQRDRMMEGMKDGEEEEHTLPQSPAQSTCWGQGVCVVRRLVKKSQAAERWELPGCFGLVRGAPNGVPTVPCAREPPSPFLPWLWGATPSMPALSVSHPPGWPLQSVGLLRGAGGRREAGR